ESPHRLADCHGDEHGSESDHCPHRRCNHRGERFLRHIERDGPRLRSRQDGIRPPDVADRQGRGRRKTVRSRRHTARSRRPGHRVRPQGYVRRESWTRVPEVIRLADRHDRRRVRRLKRVREISAAVRPTIRPADVESWGVPRKPAEALAARIEAASQRRPRTLDAREQERFWLELRAVLLANPETRWRFAAHFALYRLAYEGRRSSDGPGPAWMPSKAGARSSNIGKLMAARRFGSFEDLQRWSTDRREEFWATMIRKLGIVFRKQPSGILKRPLDPRHPEWLPGARMNIAESCFRAGANKTAILFGLEGSDSVGKMTYGELKRLSARVANGLDELGLNRGEKVALYLPMTPEAVAAYLGIVLSGRCVVGIADAAAPPEFRKRARIAEARAVITVDSYIRD